MYCFFLLLTGHPFLATSKSVFSGSIIRNVNKIQNTFFKTIGGYECMQAGFVQVES